MPDHLQQELEAALSGAYTIERELGGGGMSRVFVATEQALARTVVVKVLSPELSAGVNRDRFRREIQLAAQLQHPHVVPLLSAGERSGDEASGRGINVLTGGTDVHLVLVDLRESELDGQQAEDRLHEIGITVNRNAVPFDPRPPMVTSGLRIGTPALATRGFDEAAFTEVADIIARTLIAGATATDPDQDTLAALRDRVHALASAHPLYPNLDPMGA